MEILHAAERPFGNWAALHELRLVAVNERAADSQRNPVIVFGLFVRFLVIGRFHSFLSGQQQWTDQTCAGQEATDLCSWLLRKIQTGGRFHQDLVSRLVGGQKRIEEPICEPWIASWQPALQQVPRLRNCVWSRPPMNSFPGAVCCWKWHLRQRV